MADVEVNRFWEMCVLQVLRKIKKDFKASERDLQTVGALFERASGSWVELASGDPDHWDLLRRCCKVFLKRKLSKDEEVSDGEG